mmetsp:Transcript_12516/g.24939  ORF Transcript_12516/g.24939 Transcript_12516/m.24939 type:complete len:384 (+) Transcript_12516:2072-3223(+)
MHRAGARRGQPGAVHRGTAVPGGAGDLRAQRADDGRRVRGVLEPAALGVVGGVRVGTGADAGDGGGGAADQPDQRGQLHAGFCGHAVHAVYQLRQPCGGSQRDSARRVSRADIFCICDRTVHRHQGAGKDTPPEIPLLAPRRHLPGDPLRQSRGGHHRPPARLDHLLPGRPPLHLPPHLLCPHRRRGGPGGHADRPLRRGQRTRGGAVPAPRRPRRVPPRLPRLQPAGVPHRPADPRHRRPLRAGAPHRLRPGTPGPRGGGHAAGPAGLRPEVPEPGHHRGRGHHHRGVAGVAHRGVHVSALLPLQPAHLPGHPAVSAHRDGGDLQRGVVPGHRAEGGGGLPAGPGVLCELGGQLRRGGGGHQRGKPELLQHRGHLRELFQFK